MTQTNAAHPETPIWTFLESNNIPWQESLGTLEKRFGRKQTDSSEFVLIPNLPNIFEKENVEVHAEIWNNPPMDFPTNRWILDVTTSNTDPENSFSNISSQLIKYFGEPTATDSSNTKGFLWPFGNAEINITFWFTTQNPLGNQTKPAISVFVSPDFKLFATETDEDALENAKLIEAPSTQNLKLLPNFTFPQRNRQKFYKRLRTKFLDDHLLMGLDKDHQFFYGIQGFNAVMIPIHEFECIALVTSLERIEPRYLVLGRYKGGDTSLYGGDHFIFAESNSLSEPTKLAHNLAQIMRLKLVEERQNNLY